MSETLDAQYHEQCRKVLPPGHDLYGSSLDAGFSSLDNKGRMHEWPHVALLELNRLAAENAQVVEAARKLGEENDSLIAENAALRARVGELEKRAIDQPIGARWRLGEAASVKLEPEEDSIDGGLYWTLRFNGWSLPVDSDDVASIIDARPHHFRLVLEEVWSITPPKEARTRVPGETEVKKPTKPTKKPARNADPYPRWYQDEISGTIRKYTSCTCGSRVDEDTGKPEGKTVVPEDRCILDKDTRVYPVKVTRIDWITTPPKPVKAKKKEATK